MGVTVSNLTKGRVKLALETERLAPLERRYISQLKEVPDEWAALITAQIITAVADTAPVQPETQVYEPGNYLAVSGNLTRANNATPYVQYDLLSDANAAPIKFTNAVRGEGEGLRIESVYLHCSNASAKGETIRIHLFRTAPVFTVADNDPFNIGGMQTLAVSSVANYIGYVDVTLTEAGATGAIGRVSPSAPIIAVPAFGSKDLFASLEIRDVGGYTGVADEVWTATLLASQ